MKLTVTYELTDDQEKKLKELLELRKRVGLSTPIDQLFRAIMILGSSHDIDTRLMCEKGMLKGYVEQMKEGEENE